MEYHGNIWDNIIGIYGNNIWNIMGIYGIIYGDIMGYHIKTYMMGLRVHHVVFNMSFFPIICNVRSFPKQWGYPFVIIQSP